MLSLETSRAVRANAGGLQHLCAEIWVAEEGLAEKGTERRLDLIFQRCITVRGNISVDCQGMTLSGMKLLIFLSKVSVSSLFCTWHHICSPSITAQTQSRQLYFASTLQFLSHRALKRQSDVFWVSESGSMRFGPCGVSQCCACVCV